MKLDEKLFFLRKEKKLSQGRKRLFELVMAISAVLLVVSFPQYAEGLLVLVVGIGLMDLVSAVVNKKVPLVSAIAAVIVCWIALAVM